MKKLLFLLALLCSMLIACNEPQNPVNDIVTTIDTTTETDTTENDTTQQPEMPEEPLQKFSCLCPTIPDCFIEGYLPKDGQIYRYTDILMV